MMKILLVDDSGTMRTIQKRCLNSMGVKDISEAADGLAALDLCRSESFDIILSDWNMPKMDGMEFLKEFRKLDSRTPFIMITTEAERERVVLAIQAGVSDYLVKPFTPDALRLKLERWVGVNIH